jgi:hypothetical protein
VRAEARRLYAEMVGEGGSTPHAATPTPDPSPQGGGEKKTPDLMAHLRAMYEDSIIPVRDIAQRAGVTERTLYKYARKHAWKPRYAWMPDGSRPPARPARRRLTEQRERALQVAPAKGAGGRFIRRDDIGAPFAPRHQSKRSGRPRRRRASLRRGRPRRRARETRGDMPLRVAGDEPDVGLGRASFPTPRQVHQCRAQGGQEHRPRP